MMSKEYKDLKSEEKQIKLNVIGVQIIVLYAPSYQLLKWKWFLNETSKIQHLHQFKK